MPKITAFIFPGQGSQKLGMGLELAERYTSAKRTLDTISEVVGRDILKLCKKDPRELLKKDTRLIQMAVFAVSAAALVALREEKGIESDYVEGHSLGEVTAFHAGHGIDLETTAGLVKTRADAMHDAAQLKPGGMFVMDRQPTGEVQRLAKLTGASIANINSTVEGREQYVLSGGIEVIDILDQEMEGNPRAFRLSVPVAAHHSSMEQARIVMMDRVEALKDRLKDLDIPAVPNFKPGLVSKREAMMSNLHEQLIRGVDFSGSVSFMVENLGVRRFIEVGPGNVLSGLVARHVKGRDDIIIENFGDNLEIEKD